MNLLGFTWPELIYRSFSLRLLRQALGHGRTKPLLQWVRATKYNLSERYKLARPVQVYFNIKAQICGYEIFTTRDKWIKRTNEQELHYKMQVTFLNSCSVYSLV